MSNRRDPYWIAWALPALWVQSEKLRLCANAQRWRRVPRIHERIASGHALDRIRRPNENRRARASSASLRGGCDAPSQRLVVVPLGTAIIEAGNVPNARDHDLRIRINLLPGKIDSFSSFSRCKVRRRPAPAHELGSPRRSATRIDSDPPPRRQRRKRALKGIPQ